MIVCTFPIAPERATSVAYQHPNMVNPTTTTQQPPPNLIDEIVFSVPNEGVAFLEKQNETVRESDHVEHAALVAVMVQ